MMMLRVCAVTFTAHVKSSVGWIGAVLALTL